jgi:hypothetical protein
MQNSCQTKDDIRPAFTPMLSSDFPYYLAKFANIPFRILASPPHFSFSFGPRFSI